MKQIILLLTLTTLSWGQFKSDLPERTLPAGLALHPDRGGFSLLDSERFDVQHGFAMTMVRWGGRTFSVGSYTNQMTFLLRDDLALRTSFTLMQPFAKTLQPNSTGLNGPLYFGASLDYRPTRNTHLHLSFDNYPPYPQQGYYPYSFERR
jgi:hypothetical protein